MKKYDHFGAWTGQLERVLVNSPEAWDRLRNNDESSLSVYAIPGDRTVWQDRCESDPILRDHARTIADIVRPRFKKVLSYGVGRGCLEYLIKKEMPDLYIRCSDFAQQAVERLKRVFVEADDIAPFDMLEGRWVDEGPESVSLLYRLDTEFDDEQWQMIFAGMFSAGIEHIIFFPASHLNIKRVLAQPCKHFLCRLLNRKMVFTGYLRTEDRLKSLFASYYTIDQTGTVRGKNIYLLRRIAKG